MNAELRQDWINALRSGDYDQTIGELHRDIASDYVRDILTGTSLPAPAGYCCMGVLADLCVKKWPGKFGWNDASVVWFPGVAVYDDGPLPVILTGEQSTTSGELMGMGNLLGINEYETDLINLNDGGSKFTAIADYIEEHVPADDQPLLFVEAGDANQA